MKSRFEQVHTPRLRRRISRPGAAQAAWAALLLLSLSGCAALDSSTGIPSALDPRGRAAADIANLWWLMFFLGLLVFLLVTGLSLFILRRRGYRPGQMSEAAAADAERVDANAAENRSWIWYGGVILPAVVLTVLLFFTLRSLSATAQPPETPEIEIDIIGRQWFWDVYYTNENFQTANEIHIPVGQPVLLRLTSADVIHSFWVPQLHGKMDLIPGRTNTFWLQADEPGIYRGICAEYCGVQHARMHFIVVAESAEAYAAWAARQAEPAEQPADAQAQRGQEVFETSDCAFCHTVRGSAAEGRLGPDLTHIASRQTLAAGMLPNNRGNMAAWITGPQHIKPGNLMPDARDLSGEDLQAILAYLETLD